MESLKPCPFCGETPDFYHAFNNSSNSFEIGCVNCGIRTMHDSDKGWLSSMWNTRTSGWISVDEKLPDEDDYVLVFTDEGRAFVSFLFINHMGMFFEVEDDCGVVVTHWMPLPQPPEVNHG